MKSTILPCVLLFCAILSVPKNARAQVRVNVEFFNPSVNLFSIGVGFEVRAIHSSDTSLSFNSLWLAASAGLGFHNAHFAPVECRLTFLESRLDITCGAAFQMLYSNKQDFGNTLYLKRSPVNPTLGIALRAQNKKGGFLLRIGIGTMYHVANQRFILCPIISLGTGGDN